MNLNEVRQETLPVVFDLHKIINGSAWSFQFYLTDDNDERMDITGYSAEMIIRDKPNGKTYFELSDVEGHITITPLTGLIEIYLTSNDTDTVDVHNVVYRIDLTDDVDEKLTIMSGNIPVAWR